VKESHATFVEAEPFGDAGKAPPLQRGVRADQNQRPAAQDLVDRIRKTVRIGLGGSADFSYLQ
jgi:hypothetical protein